MGFHNFLGLCRPLTLDPAVLLSIRLSSSSFFNNQRHCPRNSRQHVSRHIVMSGRNSAAGRKLIKRACDGCKIRKIKCSELPPCDGCTAAGISCTFKKTPGTRGPRRLRPKTFEQISQRQRKHTENSSLDDPARSHLSNDARSTQSDPIPANPGTVEKQLR